MARKIMVASGLLCFLAILASAFLFVWRMNAGDGAKGPAEVFFIKTRNDANCTLLKQGKTAILIDTGEEGDAPAIIAFLKEMQVQTIDCLVLTHPDPDHIGGVAAILEHFTVRRVIQPYYAKENALNDSVTQAIRSAGISPLYPVRPKNLIFGELTVTVYPPLEKYYKKENNYSLAVLVRHAGVTMVFAGDAEEKRLTELMQLNWPAVHLYEVAHHGRAARSSAEFIQRLQPQFAVVNASDADGAVKDALRQTGARLFYTGKGTQHFISDGKNLTYIEERT